MDSRTGKWDTGEKAQHIRATSPYGDYDRDGVLNAADCQPFNPYEHGFWGDAWSAVRQRVVAPIYQRVYTPYVQAQIQRVSTGVSAAGATAQRYTQRYKPSMSYEVATERRRKVKEFVGISARKQRKVTEKELSDVQRIEKKYIAKGWIKTVHPSERRPEDIGKITGISTQKGFIRPSPQLPMVFVGSPEYQTQVTKVKALETKHVKGGFYVGDYGAYQREVSELGRLETTRTGRYEALTKEYTEYEKAQKEYERLHGLSVMGKYERKEAELGEHFKPFTSFIKESVAYAETPEIKAETERTHGAYRRLFGLPSEPFKWERKAARIESEYKMGIVEGVAEKPLKTVVTTAAFVALPPALKAGGWALKATRIAPTISKIPYIGKPIIKYTIPAVGAGLGGAYAVGTGYRIHETPPELRVREFGKITGTELAPMALGTYAGYKYLPRIGGRIVGAGTEKMSLPEIGVGKGYPVRESLTEAQVRASFKRSTLAARPTELHGAGRTVVPMETIPRHAVLPGEVEGGVYGWHASPFLKRAKVREVTPGSSELPMEYYDPILTGYFLKVPKGVEGYRLFGLDMPRMSIPSAVRTHALGIEPIPKHLKGKARWKWMETEATKGKFYMPLTKMEYEAGLPVGTKLRRGKLKYHTVVEGQRVPIYQYEVVGAEVVGKDITTVGELAAKYGEYYMPKALFTPTGFGTEYLGKHFMKYAAKDFTSEYGYPETEKLVYKQKGEKYKPYEYHKYKKPYYSKDVYKEPYYPKYKQPYYPEGGYYPKYKKPYYPEYKKPYYPKYPPSYYPTYKEPPYYPVKYPPYYPPKYPPKYPPTTAPPYYPPTYPPIVPPIPILLPTKDKKLRIKKKHKRKEREWFEHHYIPTVHELMRTPKGVGVMTPEMPELPEIHVPKL